MTHPSKRAHGFEDADAFYESLLDAHHGLDPAQSALLNARLILLLANQLGDTALLQACLDAAKLSATDRAPAPS